MARYQKQRIDYPMGSVSCATMRSEDLIPTFLYELQTRRRQRTIKRHHIALVREIEARTEQEGYYESEDADYDLDTLFNALEEYAGPYFYFGAHPGDGADYGYWLSEDFDAEFITPEEWKERVKQDGYDAYSLSLKVSDLSEVPDKYRGEVLHVNDHGNMTLYVKTSRTLREIWAVV